MIKKMLVFLFAICALQAKDDAPPPLPDDLIAQKVVGAERESFWKNHHIASIGYRRDRQKFQQSYTTLSIEDRNSMQLIIGSIIEWRKIVGHFRASYGWLIDGDLDFNSPTLYGEPFNFGKYSLGAGYSADALLLVGYRLSVCNLDNFALSLVPSGGYKYSHIMNYAQGENRAIIPDPPIHFPSGVSGFALGRFTKPNQQDWFGPVAEIKLALRVIKDIQWDFFYQYQWLNVCSKFQQDADLYLFEPASTLSAVDLFRTNSIYRASNAHKQVGGTNIVYRIVSGLFIGAHFEGSCAWTDDARYIATESLEDYIATPTGLRTVQIDIPATIHWVEYEVSFAVGYQF